MIRVITEMVKKIMIVMSLVVVVVVIMIIIINNNDNIPSNIRKTTSLPILQRHNLGSVRILSERRNPTHGVGNLARSCIFRLFLLLLLA